MGFPGFWRTGPSSRGRTVGEGRGSAEEGLCMRRYPLKAVDLLSRGACSGLCAGWEAGSGGRRGPGPACSQLRCPAPPVVAPSCFPRTRPRVPAAPLWSVVRHREPQRGQLGGTRARKARRGSLAGEPVCARDVARAPASRPRPGPSSSLGKLRFPREPCRWGRGGKARPRQSRPAQVAPRPPDRHRLPRRWPCLGHEDPPLLT